MRAAIRYGGFVLGMIALVGCLLGPLRWLLKDTRYGTNVEGRVTRPGAKGLARSQPTTRPRLLVDFANPPRDYILRPAAGWRVVMERELLTRDAALAEQALSRLTINLEKIEHLVPAYSLSRLRRIQFFILYGEESSLKGRPEGAEYFAPSAPVHNPRLDPRMASSIAIYSARHFCGMTDFGAKKMLLHELAHGWHLEQWPEDKPEILHAYENAMEKHLYLNVRRSDGTIQPEAYASVNHLEYFAEISCVWFCGNDQFPFERGDLRLYDPLGYALVEKLWIKYPASGSVIVVR